MDLSQQISVLFSELERLFKTNTVVGEPITVGNVTVIPITSISFGAGNAGAGSQKGKENDDTSGGAGGAGGKITPIAVIVIRDDEVSILPLGHRNSMESVMAQLPNIISQFKPKKEN
jgi:uncharacterized spore protein YtfJ